MQDKIKKTDRFSVRLTTHVERVLVHLAVSHTTELPIDAKAWDTDITTPEEIVRLLTVSLDAAEDSTLSVIGLGVVADLTMVNTTHACLIEMHCLSRNNCLRIPHWRAPFHQR